MTTMTALAARPFTRADLETMPDDGRRYEIIDGVLLVSAAPRHRHQTMAGNLFMVLRAACPPELQVLFAPFAVALADDTEVQPDLLVAPRSQFTERDLPGPPLLAVEVLSPSTRRIDRLLKRDRLEEAGVPSYWLIDPDEPSVLVLELVQGRYVEAGRVAGAAALSVRAPYDVVLVPDDLLL